MSNETYQLGIEGERIAVSYLLKEGYRIETTNYRCPLGQIDIIAEDKGVLAFIEVKTRRSERFGPGIEAVDYRKQQRINRIALYYLGSLNRAADGHQMCRFDVVSITREPKTGWTVELIRNAFPFLNSNY